MGEQQSQENENRSQLPTVVSDAENSTYKYATLAYAEALSSFSSRIESLKLKIETLKVSMEHEERLYAGVEKEVEFEQIMLERLSDRFCTKAESIVELESEYKASLDQAEYKKILNRKKRELIEIQSEIDGIEDLLLQKELERLNMLEKLEPKRDRLADLKSRLKELEIEKQHFENTKIDHMAQIAKIATIKHQSSDSKPIDTEVV